MADQGGFSDYEAINATRHEVANPAETGWAHTGAALGDAITGASTAPGNAAYTRGMQVGASTIDALAQARDRVQKSQAALKAAAALRNPELQAQLGYSPEIGDYAATLAENGGDPEKVTKMLLDNQQLNFRKKLGDATAPGADRHAAAFALDPATAAPKPEGPNGSVFDPLARGGSGATAVGGDQHALVQSEIGRNNATGQAATTNANTRQSQGGLFGKPPPGMRYVMNPDSNGDPTDANNYKLDNTGRPSVEQIPGMPTKGESAVSARYHEVVLNAANGISREAENVAKMGYDTSKGAMTLGGTHTGILNTITDNLGKALSTTDQQQYSSTMTNIGRYLGMIEQAGRMVPGTLAGQLDKLASTPGTTENARLYNLSLARQTMESGADTIHASGAAQAVKDTYDKALERTVKAIPFTPSDIIDFERSAKGQTLQQFLASRKSGGGATAGATDLGNGWTVVKH